MADTIRRRSLNPSQSSIITGITEVQTRHCAIILEFPSCGYTIHAEAASKYAMKTAKLAQEAIHACEHSQMLIHETQA
jgi:hypothetical protein